MGMLTTMLINIYSSVQRYLETPDSTRISFNRMAGELLRLGSISNNKGVTLLGFMYSILSRVATALINDSLRENVPSLLREKYDSMKFSDSAQETFIKSNLSSLIAQASKIDYDDIMRLSTGEVSISQMLEEFGFSINLLKEGRISEANLTVITSLLRESIVESWVKNDVELRKVLLEHYEETINLLNTEESDEENVKNLRKKVDDFIWSLHRRVYKI